MLRFHGVVTALAGMGVRVGFTPVGAGGPEHRVNVLLEHQGGEKVDFDFEAVAFGDEEHVCEVLYRHSRALGDKVWAAKRGSR